MTWSAKQLSSMAGSALLAGAILAPAAPAQAAEDWKMHIIWPEGRIEAGYFQEFADRVSEAVGPELTVELYPANSLNIADADLLRILPSGAVIQIAGTYPGYLVRDVPQFNYVLPGGVLSTAQQLEDLLPDLRPIYEEVFDEAGVTLLSFMGHGAPKTNIFCTSPVNTLEELSTKRLRVWERFHVDLFAELGVAAQNIPQNELYVALTTGVVDCAVFPLAGARALSLHEVAPYGAYLFPYAVPPLMIVVSTDAWNRLDDSARNTVREIAAELEATSYANYVEGVHDELAAEQLRAEGATLLDDFPAEDRQRFVDAAMHLWEQMCTEADESGQAICETMQARVRATQ